MILDQYGKPIQQSSFTIPQFLLDHAKQSTLESMKRSPALSQELGRRLFDGRGNEIYLGPKVSGSTVNLRLPFTHGAQVTKTEGQK